MAAYTFNQFMRDCRSIGKLPLSARVMFWLSGERLTELDAMNEIVAKCSRTVDAIGAAMTPAERADPRSLLESRRMDVADAVGVSDRELAAVLRMYEHFAQSGAMRPRWWEYVAIDALFFGLPVLLIALIVGLVLLIANAAG
jgi:signal recognition particle GTPase